MLGVEPTPPKSSEPDWVVTVVIFVATAVAVWVLWADRFFLSLDEGIYLAGAQRILHGQVIYRDFFSITGPVSFWIEAAIMGALGPTLQHARLSLVLDLAGLTAAVYWLTTQLTNRLLALGAAAFFFALETRPMFRLYVNHRWDSSAFGLLAVVLLFMGTRQPRFRLFLFSGIAAAIAAWIMPSLLAVLVVLGLWLVLNKELRRGLLPFVLGIVGVSVLAGGILALQGALVPMFRDILWASTHYPAANRVPYGYGAIAPGGLREVFAGAGGAAILARATGLIAVLLPPVLPLAVYVVWIVWRLKHKTMDQRDKLATLVLIASFGFLISTYPRWSADQLLFIAPIFYVLAAYLLDRLASWTVVRAAIGAFAVAVALATFSYSVLRVTSEPVVYTRIGRVHAGRAGQAVIALVNSKVSPGDSLFVYPYFPLVYFLSGAKNPTSYPFLQPGMMGSRAYAEVLSELRAHPPQWVFYFALPPATYHGIWPAANPRALNLTPVDHFILSNYHPVGILRNPATDFFLLERGVH